MTVDPLPGRPLTVRAPRPEEAGAVAELVNDVTSGWFGWPPITADGVAARWAAPWADRERDFRVAVSATGVPVGYATVFATGPTRVWTELRTRGDEVVVARLFEDAEARANELARRVRSGQRVVLRSQVADDQHAVASVLKRRGFASVREVLRVVIDVADAPPKPSWPEGVRVRPVDPERDGHDVHRLSMAALADTWEFQPESYEDWCEDWLSATGFDPTLWTVAEHDGRLVGLAQCRYEPPGSDLGWFELLAVDRAWRRRGLGRALLLHALREFHSRGTKSVGLGVDAENPTGALRVAEAAGGTVVQRFTTFERELLRKRGPVTLLRGAARRVRDVTRPARP